MTQEVVSEWVAKAKTGSASPRKQPPANQGSIIMQLAEKLRPWIAKMYEGVRGQDGGLVQPAHIRGIALNVAQELVRQGKVKWE